MKKTTILKNIQKRLPEDILIEDESNIEFTDDEYVSILSWIKCFKTHYEEFGKNKSMPIQFPIISKRLRLDFGFYRFPSDLQKDRGAYKIYISMNGKRLDGSIESNLSVKRIVNVWGL